MTVCIAAISSYALILATDQMISVDVASGGNISLKIRALHDNWAAMFAGDVEHVTPIFDKVEHELQDISDPSREDVENRFKEAYQKRLQTEITDTILSPYDLDLKSFKNEGAKMFGDQLFSQFCSRIEQVTLGPEPVQFLVAGFSQRSPEIFSVEHPGIVKHYDQIGFHAIGSGAYSALTMLYFRPYNQRQPIDLSVYEICEAKFMAEKVRARGVGEETSFIIWRNDHDPLEVSEEKIKEIRKRWESKGAPKIPKWIGEEITPFAGSKEEVKGSTETRFFGPTSRRKKSSKLQEVPKVKRTR